MAEKEVIETIVVEELIEGNPIFQSNGYSDLKITKNGVPRRLRIPIKSEGIDDLVEKFNKQKPTPPIINHLIKPDDEMGRDMKLREKKWVKIFDATDETYLAELEKWQQDLGMKIVLSGVDVIFKDKDGNIIEDDDRKIEIFRGMGLTGEHFTQISNDITSLTRWQEAENFDFLP